MARLDPHSYNDDTQVETESLSLIARVDFATKTLHAEATLTFRAPGGGALDLDTRDLAIDAVADQDGRALAFVLHPAEPILGARLAIALAARHARGAASATAPRPTPRRCSGSTPRRPRGGRHPFLFSQCQAIHARSVVPLQDTPRAAHPLHAPSSTCRGRCAR